MPLLDENNQFIQDEKGAHIEPEAGRVENTFTRPRPSTQLLNPWKPGKRKLLVAGDPPSGFTRIKLRRGKVMYRGPKGRFFNIDQMRSHLANMVPAHVPKRKK